MIHADFLFLLTDVDGLYTSNPRKDPDAKFIEVVDSVMDIRKQGQFSPSPFPASLLTLRAILLYSQYRNPWIQARNRRYGNEAHCSGNRVSGRGLHNHMQIQQPGECA